MITDVHTHYWTPGHQRSPWTDGLSRVGRTLSAESIDRVSVDSYRRSVAPADRSVVFGLQARASGIFVPNDDVAAFVREVGGSTVGFMSVDPTAHDAVEEIERAHEELGLVGIKLGPIYQGTSPLHPLTLRVFAEAQRRGLPVLIHQGAIFANAGRLVDANPLLLDDIAIAFPDLRIVIAHLGHPWVEETVVVMRRNANVYADTSAIANRPTMLARGLSAAKEYGVLHKILFGSDSPMVSAVSSAEGLKSAVEQMGRVSLTSITDEELNDIMHRPTFELLGIESPRTPVIDPTLEEQTS
jgi:predicted TIM-barrel fold metal-dependent hydrolase